MKASVVITGASSQVGYFLLPRLADLGYSVIAQSRNKPSFSAPQLSWRITDVAEPGALAALLQDAQVWINLVPLHVIIPQLSCFENDNLARIIAFSSTSVFTRANSTAEADRAIATQLAQAEQTFRAWCEQRGIAWTLFRPTMIYGCGRDKNVALITKLVKRIGAVPIVGNGAALRQPVHAADLAEACIAAMTTPQTYNAVYNLAGGEMLSIEAMVRRVFESCGKKPRILRLPPRMLKLALNVARKLPYLDFLRAEMVDHFGQDFCFSCEDATRDFGYSPRIFSP